MQILRAGAAYGALAILCVAFSLTFQTTNAETVCPPGSIPITGANRAQARIAGIPDSSSCWQQTNADVGQEVAQAKTYLRSILCPPDGDNYGGTGPDGTIQGLDPKFAQCAATFLKALNSSGSPYCIREGKRTVEKQNAYVARGVIACKKGAMCEHPRGIAIDINAQPKGGCTSYTRAHQMAGQYGLTFYMGCKDAYHFVPQRGGCSAGGTAPTGGTGTPQGPNAPLPTSYYDYPQYAPQGAPTGAPPFSTPLSNMMPQIPTTPTTQNNGTTGTAPTTQYPYINPTDNSYTIPLPTPTSTIVTPTAGYTFPTTTTGSTNSSNTATTSSSFDSLLSQYSAGSNTTGSNTDTSTGVSAPTSQSGPATLNEDLYTNAEADNEEQSTLGGVLAINDTPPAQVPQDQIRVTETFSGNPQHTQTVPVQASTSPAGEGAVRALLIILRDMLITFLNMLKAKQTPGFSAPWQAPTGPTYR